MRPPASTPAAPPITAPFPPPTAAPTPAPARPPIAAPLPGFLVAQPAANAETTRAATSVNEMMRFDLGVFDLMIPSLISSSLDHRGDRPTRPARRSTAINPPLSIGFRGEKLRASGVPPFGAPGVSLMTIGAPVI